MRALVPQATYYADAALITFRQQDVSPGNGTIVVAAAGTSDLFVAEEAARTAELMGNDVERVYDVGVAGLHRVLGERARLAAARVIIVVAGMEGALPSVIAGLVAVPVIAVPTSIGYGRKLRRHRRAARHAEQLRVRRVGGEYRQRLRRGQYRQSHQPLVEARSADWFSGLSQHIVSLFPAPVLC